MLEIEQNWYDEQVKEAEEIERLIKEDPWHFACYIQQMHYQVKAIENIVQKKSE